MKDGHSTDMVYFSVKGQVVIPRRLRLELGIEDWTRAVVYREGDGIMLKPMTVARYRALRGCLKGTAAFKTFLAERRRERDL